MPAKSQNEKLGPYAGKRVTVTGEMYAKGGSQAIVMQDISPRSKVVLLGDAVRKRPREVFHWPRLSRNADSSFLESNPKGPGSLLYRRVPSRPTTNSRSGQAVY